jgi:hypothetical protein
VANAKSISSETETIVFVFIAKISPGPKIFYAWFELVFFPFPLGRGKRGRVLAVTKPSPFFPLPKGEGERVLFNGCITLGVSINDLWLQLESRYLC